jgi:hypothetical protein
MVDMETGLSRLPRQAGTTVYTRPKPLLDPQLQSTHHVPSQCVYEALTPPISTSGDITIYQYGKNVLYLFYNIAQRNIKKEIFRRFRVDIELYQHGS